MTTAPTDLPDAPPAEVEAPPPHCDFCGDPNPSLSFPARYGAVGLRVTGERGLQVDPDAEPWLSCQPCAPYVRRLDAAGLAHRVSRILAREQGNKPDAARTRAKRVLQDRYSRVLVLLAAPEPWTAP